MVAQKSNTSGKAKRAYRKKKKKKSDGTDSLGCSEDPAAKPYLEPYKYTKIKGVNIIAEDVQLRVCLKCEQPFRSICKANRICDTCKKLDDYKTYVWRNQYSLSF